VPSVSSSGNDPEELALMADDRFRQAVHLFNEASWYPCHDGFEELWHETQGPCRRGLQGLLQIAVAHIHLERGNLRGATILLGEGLGRLQPLEPDLFRLNIQHLRRTVSLRLHALQQGETVDSLPLPQLIPTAAPIR
jgi:predicted metal-dependent hydrolase